MKLIWIVFCLTYCTLCEAQQNEEDALAREMEALVRRLTLEPSLARETTPRRFHSAFLPAPRGPVAGQDEEETRVPDDAGRSGQPAVDRDGMLDVWDVDQEENLARDIEALGKQTADVSEAQSMQTASASASASAKTGPYMLRRQQDDTVTRTEDSFSDVYFVAIVAGCCAVGIFGVISAGVCFYRLQKSRKAAADVDYPAYGVTGPCKDLVSPNGDRKLAQSAQMYHYQHQKQQMIAVEKAGSTKNTSASDVDSEEENEEGDYTVYECPGLAPTGEMEVKNPLFHDDSTPVSPPIQSKLDGNTAN